MAFGMSDPYQYSYYTIQFISIFKAQPNTAFGLNQSLEWEWCNLLERGGILNTGFLYRNIFKSYVIGLHCHAQVLLSK